MIGSTLNEGNRNRLCNLLQRNLDIFAWKPADMTVVPRHIAEHSLNVREGCSPVRQKKRGQTTYRNQAIQEEVGKLVEAEILKEVHYHDWLSNPVMVKKHDDSWRMCVDFKDLNKACPKDGYPLSEIDWKIGRNLELYVDDLVIKSRTEDEIVRDIEETFKTLREINMKLNPKKCTFGVEEGMFLGYKVNTKGLKVCPDKVDVILSLATPKCLKDVQKLNGKLASLNRFLAKAAEKSLLFFKTLKKCTKKSDFHWTTEAKEEFKQMKHLIAELPMLKVLVEKEELIVYLAAAKETVSAVLMTKREAKQMPIYFVNRALRDPELNYTSMEKLVLALVHAKEDSTDTLMEMEEELLEPWILFTDGYSCTDSSGARLILINLKGMEFTYALRFSLVANQVNETYVAKEDDMIRYLENIKTLTDSFKAFSIKQVPRSENKKADALSKIASTSFAHLSNQVLVEELKEKSIGEVEILAVVEEEGDTWMTPILKYLAEGTLPTDMKKARAIRRKSWRFAVVNGTLYKKSFLGPWLRCVGPLQANYVLREIHEGSCSMHAGTQSIMAKAMRTGYYWPIMHKDARTLIRSCQDCQVHKTVPRNPQQKLTPITSPWPFYKWGIDIAGPFSEGPGKVKFLIVAMDYFTKWIKAKLVATITDDPFNDWCEKLCIRQHFTSVKHPQTNGLVERANRNLGEGIKARLDARSKNWMEEFPPVLWVHRTMIKSSNGDTPFSLTYGTEEVIPAEIGMLTLRTAEVDLV
ncbi:reverse transcriptase domain-containing protein [Tanacetum coccineum]|uniref:Reverse transcriptase domain-containing protein n=1 Tax=Tanacetum coccineum TaxID=301880 RepID=A0ABQ5ES72_9ASTR